MGNFLTEFESIKQRANKARLHVAKLLDEVYPLLKDFGTRKAYEREWVSQILSGDTTCMDVALEDLGRSDLIVSIEIFE
jgi:hypothetical protein